MFFLMSIICYRYAFLSLSLSLSLYIYIYIYAHIYLYMNKKPVGVCVAQWQLNKKREICLTIFHILLILSHICESYKLTKIHICRKNLSNISTLNFHTKGRLVVLKFLTCLQILLLLNDRSIAYFSNCVGWEIGIFCRSHKKINPSFNVKIGVLFQLC